MVSDETADYWVYAKKLAISVITACTLNQNIRSDREIKFNFDTIIHPTSPSLKITLRLCNGAGGCPRKNPSSLTVLV